MSQPQPKPTREKIIALPQTSDPRFKHLTNPLMEESLIGICSLYPEAFYRIQSKISPADFSNPFLGCCYKAFEELAIENQPIDMSTLENKLMSYPYITKQYQQEIVGDMIVNLGGARNLQLESVDAYADAVLNSAVLLRLANFAQVTIPDILSKPLQNVEATVGTVFALLERATERKTHKDTSMERVMNDHFDKHGRVMAGESALLSTGYPSLDNAIGGYAKGEVTCIMGGGGTGKTTWLLGAMRKALTLGYNIDFRSLEMSETQIVTKLISQELGISTTALQDATRLSTQQSIDITRKIGEMASWTMRIDDNAQLRPIDLKTSILANPVKPDIVFIDGLWLMKANPARDESEERLLSKSENALRNVTTALVEIAKTLNVPIVILHQYNQDVKNRDNKRPLLADAMGGMAVQQDFQNVWGLHRPNLYNNDEGTGDNTQMWFLKSRMREVRKNYVEFVWHESKYQYIEVPVDTMPF